MTKKPPPIYDPPEGFGMPAPGADRCTQTKVYTTEDLWDEYVEKFGEEPHFSGWDTSPVTERLIDALETGVPIKEPPLPPGILT